MTRTKRVSIARLMGVVLVASFGLAVLRQATVVSAGVMFLLTCGVLALAVVGVACRPKAERAWWLGCALFGWGYFALVFSPPPSLPRRFPRLPTMAVVETAMAALGAPLPMDQLGIKSFIAEDIPPARTVGHCLWGLALALIGGALAHAFFGLPGSAEEDDRAAPPAPRRGRWRGWIRASVVGLAAACLVATAAFLALRWAPEFWAGAMLLLTWGVVGVAVLGTVANRGRRRLRWLGAALFGAGYMTLIFPPYSPETYEPPWSHRDVTEAMRAVVEWLPPLEHTYPPSSPEMAAIHRRIRRALDQPVSLHFANATPLDDMLRFIVENVRCADGSRLPIYVDPVGLQEAEKTMQSPVELDMEGVPLRTYLTLMLRQLGMTYNIRDGVLEITSESSGDAPLWQDPVLSVAHCLMALFAAGLGSIAAPLVARPAGDAAISGRTAG